MDGKSTELSTLPHSTGGAKSLVILVAVVYASFHYLLLAVSSNDSALPLGRAGRRPLQTGVGSRGMILSLSVPTLTQTLMELLPRE